MTNSTKLDTRAMVREMAEMLPELRKDCPCECHYDSVDRTHLCYAKCAICSESHSVLIAEELWFRALIQAALRMGWDIDLAPGIVTIETDPDADLIIKRGDDPATNLIYAMHKAVKSDG